MSDSELDAEWKPNNRPQSTMARSFSAALNDAFNIDSSIDNLSQTVQQKKMAVSTQTKELEALEARLRRTEELLKQKQSTTSLRAPDSGRNSPHRRTPLGNPFAAPPSEDDEKEQAPVASPLSRNPLEQARSRPATAKSVAPPTHEAPPIPGDFPITPSESTNGDYVVVDRVENTVEPERPKSSHRYKRTPMTSPPSRPPPLPQQ